MTISLIHPSRGRPQKALETLQYWRSKAYGAFEYVLSVDMDDPTLPQYMELFRDETICVNPNKSVVEATNNGAMMTTGDILIYLSDDFKCPDDWDSLITLEFERYVGPILIKVDDMLQPFHVKVLTIPIMNWELYNRLGYFFHPGYKSMFCDEQLFRITERLGFLKFAPHLKFEHCHVSVGKAENDETYKRSAANWDQGKALFAQHKREGFPG